jgi:aquaporin NIP
MMRTKLIAEFIGTFFLVFTRSGAVMVDHLTGKLTQVGVSLVAGLTAATLIYGIGHVSGAHFNPAITLGFWSEGRVCLKEASFRIAAQFLGGIAAGWSLLFFLGRTAHLGATLPYISWQRAWGLEFLITFLLMIVVMVSDVDRRALKPFSGVAVGGTVGMATLLTGPLTGASMNPARSLGPALVAGIWHHLWIYLTAPVLGSMLAVLVYHLMSKGDGKKAKHV